LNQGQHWHGRVKHRLQHLLHLEKPQSQVAIGEAFEVAEIEPGAEMPTLTAQHNCACAAGCGAVDGIADAIRHLAGQRVGFVRSCETDDGNILAHFDGDGIGHPGFSWSLAGVDGFRRRRL
jgi:hypothetical protein